MKKEYMSPFVIHVIWHPLFTKGEEIADYLYANFSRDTDVPLSRGIGIPTFYRSVTAKGKKTPKPISLEESEFNALVILIDDHLFNDDEWNFFVKNLIPKCNEKTRIFPIALSSNAYYFEEKSLGRQQFIDAKPTGEVFEESQFVNILKLIRHRLLHSFCRLLLGKKPVHEADDELGVPGRVKLFISHAKGDGEKVALDFRDYVISNTKLGTFFDASDIADGYQFDTQIKKAIEDGKAALVVFHSDLYSTREWCQIEVLTAKRYKSPIVVVHNIQKGEMRSFPYLGNVPTIRLDLDNLNFEEIIDLALYQILINVFQMEKLKQVSTLFLPEEFDSIEFTSPPELFNFIDILSKQSKSKSSHFVILYPDPPLGVDELRVLEEVGTKGMQFLTPIQLSRLIK